MRRSENPRAKNSPRAARPAPADAADSSDLVRPAALGRGEADRANRRFASVKRAFQIAAQREAHEHARDRGERHGNEQPDKTQQVTEREQRKHEPYRMQTDALAHQLRRQHITFEKLSDKKDDKH